MHKIHVSLLIAEFLDRGRVRDWLMTTDRWSCGCPSFCNFSLGLQSVRWVGSASMQWSHKSQFQMTAVPNRMPSCLQFVLWTWPVLYQEKKYNRKDEWRLFEPAALEQDVHSLTLLHRPKNSGRASLTAGVGLPHEKLLGLLCFLSEVKRHWEEAALAQRLRHDALLRPLLSVQCCRSLNLGFCTALQLPVLPIAICLLGSLQTERWLKPSSALRCLLSKSKPAQSLP